MGQVELALAVRTVRPEEVNEAAEVFVEAHPPVGEQVVAGREDRVVLLHHILDRLQRDVRHLGAGDVDGTHGGTKSGLDALITLDRRASIELKRGHRANRRMEVCEDNLEVLGVELFEHGEVSATELPVPTTYFCLLEERPVGKVAADVDAEAVAEQKRLPVRLVLDILPRRQRTVDG